MTATPSLRDRARMAAVLAGAVLACPAWEAAAGPLAGDAAAPALAITTADRQAAHLTLYQDGHGLVRETYRLRLPAGPATVRFTELPEALDPASLQAVFTGADVALRTQRRLGDLLTPERALEAAVGGPVTLLEPTPDGGTRPVQGILLSTTGGLLVQAGDQVLVNPDARLALPGVPAGPLPAPALDLDVETRRGGPATLELTYMTGDLGWQADHVLGIDPGGGRARLTTWVSIENSSAAAWTGARVALLAGDVRRVSPPPQPVLRMAAGAAVEADAMAPGVVRQEVADSHLYRLPGVVAIPPRATARVALLSAEGLPIRRRYVTGAGGAFLQRHVPPGEPTRLPVEIRIELTNSADSGLGVPLPAGVARVYSEQAEGGALFAGENRLPPVPVDEEASLIIGSAFDLVAERTQTDYQELPGRRRSWEAAFRLDLRNRSDRDVTLDVRERVPGDWQVLESSHSHRKADAATLAFEIPLPAGGEATLTYRVKVE